MPTDAYVRFGEDSDTDDYDQPVPLIEGDCTDLKHLNWCELRETSFGVTFPHEEKPGDGDTDQEETKQHLEHVSLKKRVDWSSTQLFLKCCQAGKASIAKNKADKEVGTIHDVTVEVCKAAGEDKFAYLVIKYKNVRVINYTIDMSDPEPSETIEFEYDSFKFGYQPTDPYTGLPDGDMIWTEQIEGTKKSGDSGQAGGSGQGGGMAAVAAAAGSDSGGGGGGGGAASGTAANGAAAGPTTTIEDAVAANFPGVWGPAGLGVLPE